MQNQQLELLIEHIKNDQGNKPKTTVKRLRPLLKAFNQYSTTAENLPPPTLIPLCLFSLPPLFRKLVGLDEGETLMDAPEQAGLRLCLQLYLKGLLRLLGECDEEIRHVVVQSMSQNMVLVNAYPSLCRKWVRSLVQLWSTSSQNLDLCLRCFTCFRNLLGHPDDNLFIWTLRRIYIGFFEHCTQITWRNLEHINFMTNCFQQITTINPTKSYYVLFGYIRTIVLQIQNLNNAKGKQKMDLVNKLYSQQLIQIFKLIGRVITVGEEMTALAYPFAEVINAFEKISQSPEYLPLKMHLLGIQLQLMENTGLYLPHTMESALKMLNSSPFAKKQGKKGETQGSIELGYKLSPQELKNTRILNDIFEKLIYNLYWFSTLAYRQAGGVQITRHLCSLLTSVNFGFSGYKKAVKIFTKILQKDATKIQVRRGKKKLSLDDKGIQKLQNLLISGKINILTRDKYQELQQERQQLFRAKVVAEQDPQEQPEEDESFKEEEEELDSGWQQASEGASEFQQSENAQQRRQRGQRPEKMQQFSYSGDPQDPDEAAKEWSEHAWSSQQQLEA